MTGSRHQRTAVGQTSNLEQPEPQAIQVANPRSTIFISKSTPGDDAFALWLAPRLEAAGYHVFADILGLHLERVGLIVGGGFDILGGVIATAAAGGKRGERGQRNGFGQHLHR